MRLLTPTSSPCAADEPGGGASCSGGLGRRHSGGCCSRRLRAVGRGRGKKSAGPAVSPVAIGWRWAGDLFAGDAGAPAAVADIGDRRRSSACVRVRMRCGACWEVEKRTSIEVSPEVPLIHLSEVVNCTAARCSISPAIAPSPCRATTTWDGCAAPDHGRHAPSTAPRAAPAAASISRCGRCWRGSCRAAPHPAVGGPRPYRSFYLLRVPAGRCWRCPTWKPVLIGGRAAVVYSQNDLGGAWARDRWQWQYDVVPGGEVCSASTPSASA